MGNNFSAIHAEKMLHFYIAITNIIVCGIAGGVPQEVHLGDVVISMNGVIQYDYGKSIVDNDGNIYFEEKDSGTPCSLYLREAVKLLKEDENLHGDNWKKYISVVNENIDKDYSIPKRFYENITLLIKIANMH